MSDRDLPGPLDQQENEQDQAPRSINLWVVYGLMFLALLVAIGLAALIVLPFYNRR
jgi:hypothetical protein